MGWPITVRKLLQTPFNRNEQIRKIAIILLRLRSVNYSIINVRVMYKTFMKSNQGYFYPVIRMRRKWDLQTPEDRSVSDVDVFKSNAKVFMLIFYEIL